MAINYILGSVEYGIDYSPCGIIIDTSDDILTVMGVGYLNGRDDITFSDAQLALVNTTDGLISLQVSIVGDNISLISPQFGIITPTAISSSPSASQDSSLVLGTAYQNTLGYDVMITVYLDVTAALIASVLLGVGPTSSPTQQTIISGITLSALSIVPISIYLPSGYYAKLSTSGTITASISGQIAMPI